MKHIFIIAILISLGLSSCKKFLNTEPTDSLTEKEYYNTESKLISALAGVYQPLGTAGIYGDNMFDQLGAATDEGFYARSGQTTGVMVYNFDYTNAELNSFWTQLYQGIERANILIKNINVASLDETKRNAILGEAYFMRAYYHFLLVSNFGDVPLKTEPTPSVTDVFVTRTPAKQVYAQILADMELAEGKVFTSDQLGFSGRVSKTVVEGILARVCLTMAGFPLKDQSKYAEALKWATKVKDSGLHSLNSSYSQVFINAHQDRYDVKESMWEVENKGNGSDGYGNANRLGNTNGIVATADNIVATIGYSYGFINTTAKLYNYYSAGDLRRDWAIGPYTYGFNTATNTVYKNYFTATNIYGRNAGKWRREYEISAVKGKNITPINFPILRYSDVLLMLAEAEFHVNGATPLAYEALNQVRRRGFGLNPQTPVTSVAVVSGLTLATAGNTGYLTAGVNNIPVTITGGGGTDAAGEALVVYSATAATAKVTVLALTKPGKGYTSAPTVTIGSAWTANTIYVVGTQVFNGNNLYTVTTAGTSTSTGPTQASGASSAAVTGAVFTYAGARATATATIATSVVDLAALDDFQQAIEDERARELCYETLRRPDLIRWGKWVKTMNDLGLDMKANAGGTAYGGLAGSSITDRNLLYPIPSSEISVNKNMTQNPGW